MTVYVSLAQQDLVLVRNIYGFVQWQGKNYQGDFQDLSAVTDTILTITHALSPDSSSKIVTYTDVAPNATVLQKIWTPAEILALPLGTFLYELAASWDGVEYQVLFQGRVSVFPTVYSP